MKATTTLFLLLLFATNSFAQKSKKSKNTKISSFEISYTATIDATSEDAQMIAMFLEGATMVIATDGVSSYCKNVLGMTGTQETLIDTKTNTMTMYLSGMMEGAYQGNMDELEEEENSNMELVKTNDTKVILGKKCKKATATDAEAGTESTFWYCEDFIPAQTNSLISAELPGLCMELVIKSEGFTMTYTATELDESISMGDYTITIPEGVEIQPLSEISNMGEGF